MSRVTSWEDDEPYPNASALFGANVERALNGKRGQALLKEIEAALLALPSKRLIGSAICEKGEVCLLGAVAIERAMKAGKTRVEALADLEKNAVEWGQCDEPEALDDDNMFAYLKDLLDIKQESLAWQLVYENDESGWETSPDSIYAGPGKGPERRYQRMLKWVQARIKK